MRHCCKCARRFDEVYVSSAVSITTYNRSDLQASNTASSYTNLYQSGRFSVEFLYYLLLFLHWNSTNVL